MDTTNDQGQPLTDVVIAEAPRSLEKSLADSSGVGFVPSEELKAELDTISQGANPSAESQQLESAAQATGDQATSEAGAEASTERPNYNFVGRDETNMIVHRISNTETHHVFDVVDAVGGTWYSKKDQAVTSEPAGVQKSHELIAALAEETVEYFAVIEAEGTDKPQDPGDVNNLIKLREFALKIDPTNLVESVSAILRTGFRSINIGERLIQKATASSHAKQISGTITIGYQIDGQQGVHKYRLVGDISRNLIMDIAAIGGSVVSDVIKKPTTKAAKVKNAEQPAQPRQQAERSDAQAGGAQLSRRLIDINEALIVEHRQTKGKVDSLMASNNDLRREVKESKALIKEVLDSNNQLMAAVAALTKALLDR